MSKYDYAVLDKVHDLRLKVIEQVKLIERLEASLLRELEVEVRPPALPRNRRRRP